MIRIFSSFTAFILLLMLSFTAHSCRRSKPLKNSSIPQKYIYLSFDDGPLNGSQKINDAILIEKMPISVMLVGEHALVRPKDVQLYKENKFIEVGNHSFTHANNKYELYYKNPQNVLEGFIKNQDTLRLKDRIARLPGRNIWRVHGRSKNDIITSGTAAADLLTKNGFSLFGWDLEWMHDPKTGIPLGSADKIFAQIEKKINEKTTFTKSHLVLLCHDEMFKYNYEESELKKLITLLKEEKGYTLGYLKNYP